jgi:hypothetical protein
VLGGLDLQTVINIMAQIEDDELLIRRALGGAITWQGQRVGIVPKLKGPNYINTFWDIQRYPPDRILVDRRPTKISVFPLWTKPPTTSTLPFVVTSFPPTWSKVLGVGGDITLVNMQHSLAPWVLRANAMNHDERNEPETLILAMLEGDESSVTAWNDTIRREPAVVQRVFSELDKTSGGSERDASEVLFFIDEGEVDERNKLAIFSAKGARLESDVAVMSSYLTDPGPAWTLQFSPVDIESLIAKHVSGPLTPNSDAK